MKRLCVFILAAVMGATFLTATTGCPGGDKKETKKDDAKKDDAKKDDKKGG